MRLGNNIRASGDRAMQIHFYEYSLYFFNTSLFKFLYMVAFYYFGLFLVNDMQLTSQLTISQEEPFSFFVPNVAQYSETNVKSVF